MKLHCLLFTLFFVQAIHTLAQESQNTVQPTIMVVPYVKEGEDIRNILESDPNKRISISSVKQGFDRRGFTTIDFEAKLKAVTKNALMQGEDQTSIKQQIIELSGADIYVEVDYILTKGSAGTMVEIILQGFDAFSGQSLSNQTGRSRLFRTENIGILSEQATESCIEPFLDVMQQKFTQIVENGRTITIRITLSQNAEISMSERVGSDNIPLKFAILKWLKQKSHKGYYHVQGTSDTYMFVDDFRIPLKSDNGENYQIDSFELDVFTFFEELQLSASTTVSGTSMLVTLN